MNLDQELRILDLARSVSAGGPGSGRRPSGVSKAIHETLTKYGYRHAGGDVEQRPVLPTPMVNKESQRNVMYHHPEGHSVSVDRTRGMSDWSVHPKQGRGGLGGTMTHWKPGGGGHVTPVGYYQGSGQDADRLDKVLRTVRGVK